MDKRTQEFYRKLHAMEHNVLSEKAENYISKLAQTGGKSMHMSVPPHIHDTDMLLGEVVRRYKLIMTQRNIYPKVAQFVEDFVNGEIQVRLSDHLSKKAFIFELCKYGKFKLDKLGNACVKSIDLDSKERIFVGFKKGKVTAVSAEECTKVFKYSNTNGMVYIQEYNA